MKNGTCDLKSKLQMTLSVKEYHLKSKDNNER